MSEKKESGSGRKKKSSVKRQSKASDSKLRNSGFDFLLFIYRGDSEFSVRRSSDATCGFT